MSGPVWEFDTTACVDCYYAVNGLEIEGDVKVTPLSSIDRGEWVESGWHVTPLSRESDHLGFSWAPCDCCSSHLGGDRYAVSVWSKPAGV
jgi:hypothetical protein